MIGILQFECVRINCPYKSESPHFVLANFLFPIRMTSPFLRRFLYLKSLVFVVKT